MKSDVLGHILESQKGIRKDGLAYLLEETISATVFAGTGGDLVTVPRISRVELSKEVCALTTHKGERFFFPFECIIGLKLEESEEKRAPGGAGFR